MDGMGDFGRVRIDLILEDADGYGEILRGHADNGRFQVVKCPLHDTLCHLGASSGSSLRPHERR